MNKLEDSQEIEFEEISVDEIGTNKLTDETITQEQINEMKMLGMPKPELVSWARWQEIQNERSEHTHMIHLAASGVPQKNIAEILGYKEAHVSKILKIPWVKAKVQNEIEKIYGADHKKALKDRALKAVEVVDEILENGKESEQASMAKWVLEHSVGKANQTTEHKHTILGDVLHRLDTIDLSKLRDASNSSPLLTKPLDPFDTVIEEVIPKGQVVGKRSGNEQESK